MLPWLEFQSFEMSNSVKKYQQMSFPVTKIRCSLLISPQMIQNCGGHIISSLVIKLNKSVMSEANRVTGAALAEVIMQQQAHNEGGVFNWFIDK